MKRGKKLLYRKLIHANRRAEERYGLHIGENANREIVKLIINHESKCIEKHSNRVSEIIVPYKGIQLRCLYDRTKKLILTFLPPLSPEEIEKKLADNLKERTLTEEVLKIEEGNE